MEPQVLPLTRTSGTGRLLICEAIVAHGDALGAVRGLATTAVASAILSAPIAHEDSLFVDPSKPFDALATTAPRIVPNLLAPVSLVGRSFVFWR